MSRWFALSSTERGVELEFVPSRDRFWPPEVMRQSPLPGERGAGRHVILTGPGAVWMYAHAAATFRVAGASDITTHTPYQEGTSDDLRGCQSLLILAGQDRDRGALLLVQLRSSPAVSRAVIDRLLTPRLEELAQLRPKELVLAGRASVEVYARSALRAVDSGARWIACWSARDGLVVVFDPDGGCVGSRVSRPAWLARAMPRPVWPVIVGVVGDPNRGKSTLSRALECYLEQIDGDGWRLDCDGQSPTPAWYLSLLNDEQARNEQARSQRQAQKRSWTPAMEDSIVHQLRAGRELFSVLIADLPGGDHRAVPPQRVPPGRERLFAEVDALILLDREDDSSEEAWRKALRHHGLEERIVAVLTSRDPQAAPSLSVVAESGLWRGVVTGLDRTRLARDLAQAFRAGLDRLWPDVLARAGKRRAAHAMDVPSE